MVVVVALDAALAEEARVVAVVVPVARSVHEQPAHLVVLHQPILPAQDEAVLAVIDLVVGDPVVGHRRVVARAVGAPLARKSR